MKWDVSEVQFGHVRKLSATALNDELQVELIVSPRALNLYTGAKEGERMSNQKLGELFVQLGAKLLENPLGSPFEVERKEAAA